MAHKGIREFTGEEISNLSIGQQGFGNNPNTTFGAKVSGIGSKISGVGSGIQSVEQGIGKVKNFLSFSG